MIEIIPGEMPEEIESENNYERLSNLGKSPSWLLPITACIMGGGIFFTRKRVKKLNSITIVQTESGSAALDSLPFSYPSRSLYNRVKIDAPHSSDSSFSCSPMQERKISEIVKILDMHSAIGLLRGGWVGHLRKLEEEIDDVPALNFLWTVFSHRELKEKVERIFRDTWKIGHQEGFLAGINKGMRRYSPEKLERDLDPWARSLKTTKAAAKHFIQKNDWEGLVNHLLATKS